MRAVKFAAVTVKAPPASVPLSQAILLGSLKLPEAKHGYGEAEGGHYISSCALVAAADAIGLLHRIETEHIAIDLAAAWPILYRKATCPACSIYDISVGTLIMHLFDDHHWTRPQIAEWVKGEEIRLAQEMELLSKKKEVVYEAQ